LTVGVGHDSCVDSGTWPMPSRGARLWSRGQQEGSMSDQVEDTGDDRTSRREVVRVGAGISVGSVS
jgi:hypothetical protein